jgi:hypothetical protein
VWLAPALRAHCIIIGCGAAILGACTAAGDQEILPGPALEPLALPVPELPPVDPSSLPTRLEAVSTVRIDISERGSISVTPIAGSGPQSLCNATPSAELSAPFASSFGTLPFDSWLEVGPNDVRLGTTHADDAVIGASTYGGLDWRLGLATQSSLGLALGDEESDMGAASEVPLGVDLGGLSLRTTMLQSEWSSAQGGEVSPAPEAVQVAYALAKTLSALEISGQIGLDSPGLHFDQSDWRTEIGLSVASGIGSCTIRPQATINLLKQEQDEQPEGSLRTAIEVDRALQAGQHLALKLEYLRQDMVAGVLDRDAPPQRTVLLRLVLLKAPPSKASGAGPVRNG